MLDADAERTITTIGERLENRDETTPSLGGAAGGRCGLPDGRRRGCGAGRPRRRRPGLDAAGDGRTGRGRRRDRRAGGKRSRQRRALPGRRPRSAPSVIARTAGAAGGALQWADGHSPELGGRAAAGSPGGRLRFGGQLCGGIDLWACGRAPAGAGRGDRSPLRSGVHDRTWPLRRPTEVRRLAGAGRQLLPRPAFACKIAGFAPDVAGMCVLRQSRECREPFGTRAGICLIDCPQGNEGGSRGVLPAPTAGIPRPSS